MVQDTLQDSRIGSNLKKLMDLSGNWIDKVHRRKPPKRLILDMGSSLSETCGRQEGSAYNGRGIAEQWIKEGKNAIKWTKLSCRTFKDNQTRMAVRRGRRARIPLLLPPRRQRIRQ